MHRVPTVDGDKTLTVREGTQSGDRLRMRGYGVPTLAGRGRGDQYVHVKCVDRTVLLLGIQAVCNAKLRPVLLASAVCHVHSCSDVT